VAEVERILWSFLTESSADFFSSAGGDIPLRPYQPLRGASTSPPPFRNERRRHLHAAGRDTGGVAGDLFFAPRLPILDTAWP
jgi:hypothetical protein